ncbi:MFS transporter [Leucobacter sp.]
MRPLPTALVLAGLLLVAGNLRAAITTVGPVLNSIVQDLGLTSIEASALVSLPLIAFAVVSPFAPGAARRLGLERTIGLSLLLLAVGLVVRSTPPVALLWTGTVMLGVAIAVLNVLLPALVKRDFPQRIGQITGAYSAVQSIFAAIAAGIAVPIAGLTALGWRLPLGMWAGLALIALGVLAPQLRRRAIAPIGPRVSVDPAVPAAAPPAPASPAVPALRSPWGSLLAWQVTVFMGLQSVVFYVLITWLPAIETSAGISEAAAGGHQFLLNACGILGSLTCSALIARLRDQRMPGVLIPLMMLVGTAGILLAPQAAALWACIAGFAGGASIVLALSLFGLRTEHHSQAAALSGMAQCVGYLLAAAGPVAVGALHDATGSWAPALIVLLVVELVLMGFGYLVGRSRTLQS